MSSLENLFPKLPGQKYPIHIDWFPMLRGQSITSRTVVSVNADTGAAANVAADVGVSGSIQTFRVQGGNAGDKYKITASVTLTDGSIFEKDYYLDVVPNLRPLLELRKQSSEKIDLGIFFAKQLKDDTISTVSFLSTDMSGSSVDILVDRGFQDDLVSFRVQGGTSGQDYFVSAIVDTNGGYRYIEQVLIRVRDE